MLRVARADGLDVFLYFGKLNARRTDGLLTASDKSFLTKHKDELIKELKNLTAGIKIEGEQFYGNLCRDKYPKG